MEKKSRNLFITDNSMPGKHMELSKRNPEKPQNARKGKKNNLWDAEKN